MIPFVKRVLNSAAVPLVIKWALWFHPEKEQARRVTDAINRQAEFVADSIIVIVLPTSWISPRLLEITKPILANCAVHLVGSWLILPGDDLTPQSQSVVVVVFGFLYDSAQGSDEDGPSGVHACALLVQLDGFGIGHRHWDRCCRRSV